MVHRATIPPHWWMAATWPRAHTFRQLDPGNIYFAPLITQFVGVDWYRDLWFLRCLAITQRKKKMPHSIVVGREQCMPLFPEFIALYSRIIKWKKKIVIHTGHRWNAAQINKQSFGHEVHIIWLWILVFDEFFFLFLSLLHKAAHFLKIYSVAQTATT